MKTEKDKKGYGRSYGYPKEISKRNDLAVYNKGFKEGIKQRNAEVKQAIEDTDLELMFTDIKDDKGKKAELSDELMEIIRLWWEKISKELLQKLGLGK